MVLDKNISLFFVVVLFGCLIFAPTKARVLHNIYTRSLESQREPENVQEASLSATSGEQRFWVPSQVSNFQYLLPFWWHYLRPMLNLFARDTKFRQTLQKEYEYELEYGDSNEQELPNTESSDFLENGNLEMERSEVELGENKLEMKVTEPPTDFAEGENLTPELENTEASNPVGLFGTEVETGDQSSDVFPETETMTEHIHSEADGTNSESSNEVENTFMELDQGTSERETSETDNQEHSDAAPWQFGLTGNIVGAFSNSLIGLMPSITDTTEANEGIGQSGDEIEANNDARGLESSEALNFGTEIENTAMSDFGHTEETRDLDVGLQNGFQIGGFINETPDGQNELTGGAFPDDATTFQNTFQDRPDSAAESFVVSTFSPSPAAFFPTNFDSQNEHDSST